MANLEMTRGTGLVREEIAPIRLFSAEILASDNVVPVVLEFHQPPVAVYKRLNSGADEVAYYTELCRLHKEFLEKLSSLGMDVELGTCNVVEAAYQTTRSVTVPHDFTHVFNGVGVLMPGRVVAQVSRMKDVRTVTHNRERVYLQLDKSVPFSGGPQMWGRSDAAGRALRGDGFTVAVIDTGIDWTHPAFGGWLEAPIEKVMHAASLTGENPLDNFGHGSHVAGIIAADASYKGTPRGDSMLDGMAPKAKLMGYKVLSASGSGSATSIILAMEDAVKRGAHVINLSLGDIFGDPLSPESSAANNAMRAGVIVCAAAGNSGPERNTIGAPGAAHDVITVGASTDDGVTVLIAELEMEGDLPAIPIDMQLLEGSITLPTPAMEVQFVSCGMGLMPTDFPSQVSGRIALVQRGEITFLEKAENAQRAGAVACLIYNNRPGNFFGTLGDEESKPAIPVVSISQANGEIMLGALGDENQSRVNLKLRPDEVPQPNRMADFSSRGPNNDRWIKPELTAPGVNITSATIVMAPSPGGGMPDPSGYIDASGTSMATPHVAGAAALLRQAHPEWSSLQIKAALVNTAHLMEGQGDVMDQGNGAMDLIRAMDCRAVLVTATDPISPTHSFGRVAHQGMLHQVSQSLTIQQIIVEPDGSSYHLHVAMHGGMPEGMAVDLSVSTLECTENCVASFLLTVTVDGTVIQDGAYSGWVVAEAEWGRLTLPIYMEVSPKPRSEEPPGSNGNMAPAAHPGRRRVGSKACC